MVIRKSDKKKKGAPDVTGPRSLTRLLALFSLLSSSTEGLTLAKLSAALTTPKSSLLNLLRPLVAEGFLLHDGVSYRLGPAMFRLSAGVLGAWQFPKTIRPFMEELSQRTQETVLLGVIDKTAEVVIYVDVIDSPHPIRYQIPAGTTRPLYASAVGRLLVAHADEAWTADYLSTVNIKVKTATQVTRASLKRDIKAIQSDGMTWAMDGYLDGLSSVVAPVFDAADRCVAGLCIAGPTDRFKHDLETLKATLKDVAARASGMAANLAI